MMAHWALIGDDESMKKFAVVALILVFIAGMAFAADPSFGVGKTRSITFANDVKVGNTVLPAGEYKILHLMEANEHTLVFKSLTNQEKVRVKCNMVQLDKKSEQTYSEMKTIGNDKVLVAIVFRGDNFRHAF